MNQCAPLGASHAQIVGTATGGGGEGGSSGEDFVTASVIASADAVAAADVAASITNMTRLYEVALCLSF